jgi:signal transduction histidine kinase/multidrug transporter EmrE-like cation transporter
MSEILEFFLQFLSQFAGGPGPMENSLVRFGMTAILWGALLIVAWSRQRNQDLPREKLLVWGFGLGFTSAVLMVAFVSLQMLEVIERQATYAVLVPLDRALAMASVVVVAGAFLRYILDDARLARVYLLAGLAATILCLMIALWQWPLHLDIVSEDRFHSTWGAWLFPVASSTFMVIATVLLRRKRGWLSNVVSIALLFFLVAEFMLLTNYATDRMYSDVLCPIGNSFRILAIPLLGYVYLREQAIEKRRAEGALEAYRHHLEELVEERTAELTAVNAKLAAQNAVAATLSRSLELETILDTTLDVVLSVAEMDVGLIFLWDPAVGELTLQSSRGQVAPGEAQGRDPYVEISAEAVAGLRAVIQPGSDPSGSHRGAEVAGAGPQMLISAPLVAKGRAVGALTLGSRRVGPIQEAEMELVTAIGQQIGMAIENAHLYLTAERSAEMLTLLHQVSIVLTSTLDPAKIYDQIAEQSVKLLGCQMACIFARGEQEHEAGLVSIYGMSEADAHLLQADRAPSGCLQELITCQPSIAIGDAQDDPRIPAAWREVLGVRAFLCVPIRGSDEQLGSLFLMDRRAAWHWRLEELELIESFVNRAAVALMNAKLHKQLEWAAALEERQRIAADMHDGLAQTTSILGLRVDDVMELIAAGSGSEAIEELSDIRGIVEQVSVDVRRSIASLHETPQPRRSLQEMLSDLPDQLPTENGPAIDLVYRVQEPLFLPLEQATEAMLVVQEALLNARRHGQAQQISLLLERDEGEIRMTVEDDGRGFDPSAWWKNSQDHFGVSIMHARAARIGARLQIDSVPGEGTRVILALRLEGHDHGPRLGAVKQDTARGTTATQGIG